MVYKVVPDNNEWTPRQVLFRTEDKEAVLNFLVDSSILRLRNLISQWFVIDVSRDNFEISEVDLIRTISGTTLWSFNVLEDSSECTRDITCEYLIGKDKFKYSETGNLLATFKNGESFAVYRDFKFFDFDKRVERQNMYFAKNYMNFESFSRDETRTNRECSKRLSFPSAELFSAIKERLLSSYKNLKVI